MDLSSDLAAAVDALLPQTQCTRCGYTGCRPYAEAIVREEAGINQCPPGGAATIVALARLLRRPILPLNPANGTESAPTVAVIDEAACIGCAKCLPACPVDAIVGARQLLHTVIASECTGCELCIAPCPVDCISMAPVLEAVPAGRAATYRARFEAHTARLAERDRQRRRALEAHSLRSPATGGRP